MNAERELSHDKNVPFTSTNQIFVDKLVFEPDPRASYIHPLYISSNLSVYLIIKQINIQYVIATSMHEIMCQNPPLLYVINKRNLH